MLRATNEDLYMKGCRSS